MKISDIFLMTALGGILLAGAWFAKEPGFLLVDSIRLSLKNAHDKAECLKRQIESTQAKLVRLKGCISAKEQEYNTALRNLILIDPGPQPSWWLHPWDHYWWAQKNAAYLTAQEVCDGLKRECDEARSGLQETECNLQALTGGFWNNFARPFLHFMLGFAVIAFAVNRTFRVILIRGMLGTKRLCHADTDSPKLT